MGGVVFEGGEVEAGGEEGVDEGLVGDFGGACQVGDFAGDAAAAFVGFEEGAGGAEGGEGGGGGRGGVVVGGGVVLGVGVVGGWGVARGLGGGGFRGGRGGVGGRGGLGLAGIFGGGGSFRGGGGGGEGVVVGFAGVDPVAAAFVFVEPVEVAGDFGEGGFIAVVLGEGEAGGGEGFEEFGFLAFEGFGEEAGGAGPAWAAAVAAHEGLEEGDEFFAVGEGGFGDGGDFGFEFGAAGGFFLAAGFLFSAAGGGFGVAGGLFLGALGAGGDFGGVFFVEGGGGGVGGVEGGCFDGAEDGAGFFAGVDEEGTAIVAVNPEEVAFKFEVDGGIVFGGGKGEAAFEEGAFEVGFGLFPAAGEEVEGDGLAGAFLVFPHVGFDGVEEGGEVVVEVVPVIPVVGGFVGGVGVVVAFGVAEFAEVVGGEGFFGEVVGGVGFGFGFGGGGGVLALDEFGAEFIGFDFGGGGDGGFEGPFALGGAAGEAVEGEGVIGVGVKGHDVPFFLAELVEEGFEEGGGGEAAFAAADDFVFPEGHKRGGEW